MIDKSGDTIVDWMAVNGVTVAQKGQLVCILQNGPETNPEDSPPPREKYLSSIKKVTLEQSGPVRAVVKIEGMHKGVQSGREWLPFTVRLYFYSGETAVRLVHTIVFDGDQEKDFVRGLGVDICRADARSAREPPCGASPAKTAASGPSRSSPAAATRNRKLGQPIAGARPTTPTSLTPKRDLGRLQTHASPTPDGFTIIKRTNPQSTWLYSNAGKRSSGFCLCRRHQRRPRLEREKFLAVLSRFAGSAPREHARRRNSTAWLWSPDGPEMDMRHYDTLAHGLATTYEDVQPGFSTAYGIGRTSELTLFPTEPMPARADTSPRRRPTGTEPPMIAATPDYIHSTGVFGYWSVQDRSTPFKTAIEDGLDAVLAFYEKQVDERHWYGFWQFGDFIHSYNNAEHAWYYDCGGHAWDNTELGAPLWLWYSYLRTGRADLFRLAEAHTRNTSETVVYHLGPMMGLGTRHNVVKWGDGAKEARISQSAHWRFYYYLTTDERVGDIMRDNLQADVAVAKFDPMREAQPHHATSEKQFPGRIRVGPDWFALVEQLDDRMGAHRRHQVARPHSRRRQGPGQNALRHPHRPESRHGLGSRDRRPLSTLQQRHRQLQPRHHPGRRRSRQRTEHAARRPGLAAPVAPVLPPARRPRRSRHADNTTHNEGGQAQYYGNGGGNADEHSAPRRLRLPPHEKPGVRASRHLPAAHYQRRHSRN